MQYKDLQTLFSGITAQQSSPQDVEVLSPELAAQLKSGGTARLAADDDLLATGPARRRVGVGSWLQRVGQAMTHWSWPE